METLLVPAAVAHVLFSCTGRQAVLGEIASCGRLVGARVEVDVDAVRAVAGAELAEQLVMFDQACREFFDSWVAGERTGPFVVVARELLSVRQQDTKAKRSDLVAQLEACQLVGELADLVEEICSAEPDWNDVERSVAGLAGSVVRDGNQTDVSVRLDAAVLWPAELGGPATRGEVARELQFTVNHAAWRDRKARRLVAVSVSAFEVWPDPAAAKTH